MTDRASEQCRVALVTGGSRGLRRSVAVRLARDGIDVAIHYLAHREEAGKTTSAVEDGGRRALVVRADVSVKAHALVRPAGGGRRRRCHAD